MLSECCRDAVMYSLSALVLLHVYIRPADSYIKRFAFTNICPASDARLCVLHPWYLYLGYSFQSVTNKRYFGTQSLIPFGFNIAEPHLVARPLKEKKIKMKCKI